MGYIENPKTKGSGIKSVIPQQGRCPYGCEECFFQGHNRSYLAPLSENLPNMLTPEEAEGYVIRVNDGNDSNYQSKLVKEDTKIYKEKFYNTSVDLINHFLPFPVVLTVNPGQMTDADFYKLKKIPVNLMFVRARVNTWNLGLIDQVVEYYSTRHIPIILTFMAYYKTITKIPKEHILNYKYRTRTKNKYYAITTKAWERVMERYRLNPFDLTKDTLEPKLQKWVYSCGFEGELGTSACQHCGNCLREYYRCREKIKKLLLKSEFCIGCGSQMELRNEEKQIYYCSSQTCSFSCVKQGDKLQWLP
jgi:hypothetical protein